MRVGKPKLSSARVALGLFFAFSFATTAYGNHFSDCVRLVSDLKRVATDMKSALKTSAGWHDSVTRLMAGLTPHDTQPFVIKVSGEGGSFTYMPTAHDFDPGHFVIGSKPTQALPEGGQLLLFPTFGYNLPDTFRRIGPLEYILLDANGRVVEVGAGTEAVKTEFLRHLHGVSLSSSDLARISDLNARLLADLRKIPAGQAKVREFAAKRGWPVELADEGGLAYFDPSVINLDDWAKANGFTKADLIDAGWYRLEFDRFGKTRYAFSSPDSIKIPFFNPDGKGIPVWRSRNLAKSNPKTPKYISWQKDRSVDRLLGVHERLYNGDKLPLVKGKRIVITEGEFKCLVTEKLTGVPMFGIPGITEFDDEMLNTLIDAQASEYVIILDRDPHGKALLRAEEISDSERASYAIAKDLERLARERGKTIQVRVGLLPDIGGEKLGIDDLALKYGSKPVFSTIFEATTADAYAKRIGLNPDLEELSRRRSRLRKAALNRRTYNGRHGNPLRDVVVQKSEVEIAELDRVISLYMENELNGARSMSSPSWRVNSLFPIGAVPLKPGDRISLRDGRKIDQGKFAGDILLLDYVPSDLNWRDCLPGKCGQVPFSKTELEEAFAGLTPSGALDSALDRAHSIAEEMQYNPRSIEEFALLALAGNLTKSFPIDEYRFEFAVRFMNSNTKGSTQTLPITVFKRDSERAIAIANLHLPTDAKYWASEDAKFRARVAFLRGSEAIKHPPQAAGDRVEVRTFTPPSSRKTNPETPNLNRASGL